MRKVFISNMCVRQFAIKKIEEKVQWSILSATAIVESFNRKEGACNISPYMFQ